MRLFAIVSFSFVIPVIAQDPLPPGEGKAVVERVCAPCHGTYPLAQRNRTREAWQSLVDSMEARGAKGTDADFQIVVQYLTANFGIVVPDKVNINKASSRVLTNFFKLFPEEGEAIVAYREKNGEFKDWQDLQKVPRLDASKIEKRKDSIIY